MRKKVLRDIKNWPTKQNPSKVSYISHYFYLPVLLSLPVESLLIWDLLDIGHTLFFGVS